MTRHLGCLAHSLKISVERIVRQCNTSRRGRTTATVLSPAAKLTSRCLVRQEPLSRHYGKCLQVCDSGLYHNGKSEATFWPMSLKKRSSFERKSNSYRRREPDREKALSGGIAVSCGVKGMSLSPRSAVESKRNDWLLVSVASATPATNASVDSPGSGHGETWCYLRGHEVVAKKQESGHVSPGDWERDIDEGSRYF